MVMHDVSSSNISSIGYDNDTQTLQVVFNDGSTYQYFDVPETVFQDFLGAGSVGSYLHQNIKGTYRYSRV
jgi:hypothetical protein